MQLQTTLVYTKPLLKSAVLCFWWRVVGVKYLIAIGFVAAGLIYGITTGNKSWFIGALASFLFFAIAIIVALYFVHYYNVFAKFKAMGEPSATCILDEHTLFFASGAGSATLPWSSVTEVWRFTDCWLLLYSKSQFSTLPVANLSPEMQAFIVERVIAAGGKIS
jgi:YcxB-like protein